MYIAQSDEDSCGPVGFFNALKFQGFDIKEEFLEVINKYLEVTKDGAKPPNIRKLCKQLGYKRLPKPTLTQINDYLKEGYGILIETDNIDDKDSHMYFISSFKDELYTCHNIFKTSTEHIHMKPMRGIFIKPKVWVVEKIF